VIFFVFNATSVFFFSFFFPLMFRSVLASTPFACCFSHLTLSLATPGPELYVVGLCFSVPPIVNPWFVFLGSIPPPPLPGHTGLGSCLDPPSPRLFSLFSHRPVLQLSLYPHLRVIFWFSPGVFFSKMPVSLCPFLVFLFFIVFNSPPPQYSFLFSCFSTDFQDAVCPGFYAPPCIFCPEHLPLPPRCVVTALFFLPVPIQRIHGFFGNSCRFGWPFS